MQGQSKEWEIMRARNNSCEEWGTESRQEGVIGQAQCGKDKMGEMTGERRSSHWPKYNFFKAEKEHYIYIYMPFRKQVSRKGL